MYRINSAGTFQTLVNFAGNGAANKGSSPRGTLIPGSDGNFYGSTASGGANNLGTVFKVTPAGALTTLVHLTGVSGANKGSDPQAALYFAGDGNFYGTTSGGGSDNGGTIF